MSEVIEQVRACLHCKNALCQRHCPIKTNIPTVIQMAQDGLCDDAARILFDNNFMSAICGFICDHGRQCYGNCVLNHKNNPVPFYQLEAQLSQQYLKALHVKAKESNDLSFAIVGAGPAGMAMAFKLAMKGCSVTLIDNHERMGGVLRYGIPDFRLDKSLIDQYERILFEAGVKFVNNTIVDKDNVRIIQAQHDVLILAHGAWIGKQLDERYHDMPNVYTALDVLNQRLVFDRNAKVIVLGGGNVAMDVVRYMKRQCDNTQLYYRKEIKDMPANKEEIDEMLNEGIHVEELAAPLAFDEKGIIFAKGETIVDENGKKVTRIVENSEYHVECDVIIQAISQQVDSMLFKTLNLTLNKWGNVDAANHGVTSNAHVYVIGDALLGPKSVVDSMVSVNELVKVLEKRYGI